MTDQWDVPLTQRVRDITVAEAISSAAGIDEAPAIFMLSPIIQAVIPLQPRPALAGSGYFPGTIGLTSIPSALNFSHVGIQATDPGRSIVRVNWALLINTDAGGIEYRLRRFDAPVAGFTSVVAVPGYIDAGQDVSGAVAGLTKNDSAVTSGVSMARFNIAAASQLFIPGPWILNDGALLISSNIINTQVDGAFGYEVFPATTVQPAG